MDRSTDIFGETITELQSKFSVQDKKSELGNNRRDYAKIDFGSMGVNLKEHFMSSEKQNAFNHSKSLQLKIPLNRSVEKNNNIKGDIFDNATLKYISANVDADLIHALKNQKFENRNLRHINDVFTEKDSVEGNEKDMACVNLDGIEEKDKNKDLPQGWEKHEDNDGPYYWHIKSGTIQREPPILPKYKYFSDEKECGTPMFEYAVNPTIDGTDNYTGSPPYGSRMELREFETYSMTRSRTIPSLNQEQGKRARDYVRKNYPLKPESSRLVRFTVRSLGWVKIAEEDLVPERSSKAVNKCIIDLSLGRNDLLDVVGRWGDGKTMYMDLEDGSLKLIDAENLTVLNSQPIHTIRVWGVGRDNGRDFAYVSRDRLTRIHMCHVFRCDTAARIIANTLRDICKQIMIERSLQLDTNIGTNNFKNNQEKIRPTNLQTENFNFRHSQSFPTPMEEPKKILKALYMGWKEVTKPTGMEIINEAINSVIAQTRPEDWENVNVAIAPSMISIRSSRDHGKLIAECRVRYLSFLGIGKNFKKCAFIVHTARNRFVAHVFHCEPSSGALCKTVEAACKLRYQKCLDAHPENAFSLDSISPSKGFGATIKDIIHSLSLKRISMVSEKYTTSNGHKNEETQ